MVLSRRSQRTAFGPLRATRCLPVEPSGQIYELTRSRLFLPVIPSRPKVGHRQSPPDTPDSGRRAPRAADVPEGHSVIGPDDPIAIPAWSDEVAFEGELPRHGPGQGRSVSDAPFVRFWLPLVAN